MNVMDYQKDVILDADDLRILKEVWENGDPDELRRTNNLFYIKLLKIKAKFLGDDIKITFMNVLKKIASITDYEVEHISSGH